MLASKFSLGEQVVSINGQIMTCPLHLTPIDIMGHVGTAVWPTITSMKMQGRKGGVVHKQQ